MLPVNTDFKSAFGGIYLVLLLAYLPSGSRRIEQLLQTGRMPKDYKEAAVQVIEQLTSDDRSDLRPSA